MGVIRRKISGGSSFEERFLQYVIGREWIFLDCYVFSPNADDKGKGFDSSYSYMTEGLFFISVFRDDFFVTVF